LNELSKKTIIKNYFWPEADLVSNYTHTGEVKGMGHLMFPLKKISVHKYAGMLFRQNWQKGYPFWVLTFNAFYFLKYACGDGALCNTPTPTPPLCASMSYN
jgi:hypothetical protein